LLKKKSLKQRRDKNDDTGSERLAYHWYPINQRHHPTQIIDSDHLDIIEFSKKHAEKETSGYWGQEPDPAALNFCETYQDSRADLQKLDK